MSFDQSFTLSSAALMNGKLLVLAIVLTLVGIAVYEFVLVGGVSLEGIARFANGDLGPT
ncbi:hypothetical protein EV13_1963 [Prochlorococcus sp. MIT 0702]|nr:hypothetical protein EV13_1963 [Prochlorococcus sp. MIT 0702]KGG28123.1 hypothetical protein EV12_0872 [Prochlorococcus sp. MIT 0701]KGG32798.1 hypothetical protein EV14_1939 [Prochlorococcus sp. MIT 0703]